MATERRILIVDNDDTLIGVLNKQLQLDEGFLATKARTAKEGFELAKTDYFDVILLDVSLPDMDGYDACRLMRQNSVTSPIMMLTRTNSDAGILFGLDAGANDYIAKPFRLGVLLARLRAHIRQHDRSDNVVFSIGPYRFKPSDKVLVRDTDQCKLRLTDKETAILKYLHKAGDKVVSREVLLDQVWGYNASVTTHTLETHIYRLRQKIEPDPSNVKFLITELGGYRLKP
jgi:DNA-binding response OmpR family regulator